MTLYAVISRANGDVIEVRDLERDISIIGQHPAKDYLLPLVDVRPSFDAAWQVEEGPDVSILEDRVERVWTVRAKQGDDLAALRRTIERRLEAEFQARITAPIEFIGHTWHADAEAVRRLMGIKLLTLNVDPQATRSWTPKGALVGVTVTYAQLEGMGTAIAVREDALYILKKQKQATIAEADAEALGAYDVSADWE